MITVDTERLVLRSFNDTDLDYTIDIMRRPDVMRYLYWEPMSPDEVAALLKRRMRLRSLEREGDGLVLAAVLRETGKVIGDVSLRWVSEPHRQGDIGFIFHPAAQGKGYAFEAARAMLRFGFDQIGFHRIDGRCDARNTASARLMERLGMRQEAHLTENEWFKGEWGSELVYAVLDREWAAIGAET